MMNTFVLQPGHPIVFVKRNSSNSFTMTQRKFAFASETAEKEKKKEQGIGPLWLVPVTLTAFGQDGSTLGSVNVLLQEQTQTFTFESAPFLEQATVVMANADHVGFYRTWQEDLVGLGNKLFTNDHFALLPPAGRAAIIDDTFALFRTLDNVSYQQHASNSCPHASVLDCSVEKVLRLVDTLTAIQEESETVLSRYYSRMCEWFSNFVVPLVTNAKQKESLRIKGSHLAQRLACPLTQLAFKLGTRSDGDAEKALLLPLCWQATLEAAILGWWYETTRDTPSTETVQFPEVPPVAGGVLEPHYSAIKQQIETFLAVGFRATAVDPNLCSTSAWCAAAFGSDEIRGKMLQEVSSPGDHRLCQVALCRGSRIRSDLDRIFSLAEEGEVLRPQYGYVSWIWAAQNRFHPTAAFEGVRNGIEPILKLWGGGQFRIHGIVDACGAAIGRGEEAADQFRRFWQAHPCANARLAVERAAEGIEVRGMLVKTFLEEIAQLA